MQLFDMTSSMNGRCHFPRSCATVVSDTNCVPCRTRTQGVLKTISLKDRGMNMWKETLGVTRREMWSALCLTH